MFALPLSQVPKVAVLTIGGAPVFFHLHHFKKCVEMHNAGSTLAATYFVKNCDLSIRVCRMFYHYYFHNQTNIIQLNIELDNFFRNKMFDLSRKQVYYLSKWFFF